MKHTANIGPTEKWIRIGVGALAGVGAIYLARKSKLASGLLALTGFSGLQSGITNYCAVKGLFGWGQDAALPSPGQITGKAEKLPFKETETLRESIAI